MTETILVKAELEFEVELDGTRKNNFTVYDGEVDDEDLY